MYVIFRRNQSFIMKPELPGGPCLLRLLMKRRRTTSVTGSTASQRCCCLWREANKLKICEKGGDNTVMHKIQHFEDGRGWTVVVGKHFGNNC